MSNEPDDRARRFGRMVGKKAHRRIEAQRSSDNAWFWLGMLGLVGWSVAIPTLAGVALGLWLDRVAPAEFSWVLTLLVVGLALGCLNAWLWVRRESEHDDGREKKRDPPPDPEEGGRT